MALLEGGRGEITLSSRYDFKTSSFPARLSSQEREIKKALESFTEALDLFDIGVKDAKNTSRNSFTPNTTLAKAYAGTYITLIENMCGAVDVISGIINNNSTTIRPAPLTTIEALAKLNLKIARMSTTMARQGKEASAVGSTAAFFEAAKAGKYLSSFYKDDHAKLQKLKAEAEAIIRVLN